MKVKICERNGENPCLTGYELAVVKGAGRNLSRAVTAERVARQIRVATDLTIMQLKQLCELMNDLRQALQKLNEDTDGHIQSFS